MAKNKNNNSKKQGRDNSNQATDCKGATSSIGTDSQSMPHNTKKQSMGPNTAK